MAAGDYPEAAERARVLVERFPDYSGTRRLLVEALERSGVRAAATLAAYQWVELKPNSLSALETLLRLAVEGAHPFLAKDIAARMRALGAMLPDLIPAVWDLGRVAASARRHPCRRGGPHAVRYRQGAHGGP